MPRSGDGGVGGRVNGNSSGVDHGVGLVESGHVNGDLKAADVSGDLVGSGCGCGRRARE